MKSHRLSATLVLALLALAPLAFAQTGKAGKKKGTKGAPSASASAPAEEAAPPAPPPEPTPAPEASASASAASDLPVTPPDTGAKDTDTAEEKGERYYFVGARYRGNLVPQFLMNLFVNEGATVFSNSVGLELDMRTDGHSTIPWISYANYDTGNMLFLQKGKDQSDPGNYSDVQSRLGAIYLGLDEMWSTPLDEAHHWDFEYGFGVGIGVLFGNLYDNWVYFDNNGPLSASNGHRFSQCPGPGTTLPAGAMAQPNGNPCAPADHQNSQDTKTGGYTEKNWFGGGSVPVIFPHISVPQFSIRYKPVKEFEARFGLGFSITGFWFGISGDYGLEKPKEEESTPAKKASQGAMLRGTL